jgi:hypothetical protein
MTERTVAKGAAHYEFVVRGDVGRVMAVAFADFSIVTEGDGSVRLTGRVPDQPAVLGVICRLQNLGLDVTSMRRVEIGSIDP